MSRSTRRRWAIRPCGRMSRFSAGGMWFAPSRSCRTTIVILPFSANERFPITIVNMKSFEVIRQAVDEPGVKSVAAALKVSPALVYKWCEQPAEADDPDQSGAKNPLDRVREMYMLTKDIRLIRFLCNEAGGFYV